MESVEFFPIDIEQTSWSVSADVLSKIRHQVFVKEQGVPEDEEFDLADSDAIHWVAYGPSDSIGTAQHQATTMAIGCARLCGDKVGRMAVLDSQRKLGVGSALLRHIIRYGADNGLEKLQLNAQTHAVAFYEGMHFEADGDEFIEAGIAHRHMTLSLNRFIDPKITPPLPNIADEERQRISLDNVEEFAQQAKTLIKRTHRKIRIFSKELAPNIYNNEELYRLIFDFARSHPYAEIQILIKNPRPLVQNSHSLLHLCHHLPSRVQIKSLNPNIKTLHSEFLLVDQVGILYIQDSDRYSGYVIYYSPMEGLELADNFDSMWESSEPDPELRRLPI